MNLFLRKNVFRIFDFVENPIIKKMEKKEKYLDNIFCSVVIIFKQF